jgi:hypothetical protein
MESVYASSASSIPSVPQVSTGLAHQFAERRALRHRLLAADHHPGAAEIEEIAALGNGGWFLALCASLLFAFTQ